jgi:hypothetical protein
MALGCRPIRLLVRPKVDDSCPSGRPPSARLAQLILLLAPAVARGSRSLRLCLPCRSPSTASPSARCTSLLRRLLAACAACSPSVPPASCRRLRHPPTLRRPRHPPARRPQPLLVRSPMAWWRLGFGRRDWKGIGGERYGRGLGEAIEASGHRAGTVSIRCRPTQRISTPADRVDQKEVGSACSDRRVKKR